MFDEYTFCRSCDVASLTPLGVSCARSGTLGSDYLIIFWTGQILLFKNRDIMTKQKFFTIEEKRYYLRLFVTAVTLLAIALLVSYCSIEWIAEKSSRPSTF